MKYIKNILTILIFTAYAIAQLPTELGQNESYFHSQTFDNASEYILNIVLASDTSWEEVDNESAILTIKVNNNYNQDIVIYNGSENHIYKQMIYHICKIKALMILELL